ncbi:PrpF domain-containing protein [Rhodobacter sp. 24-YEA-8]|uniref:PrpF domain-containing protein n=1 Tax=Rhodobacter sp. 24-YEA-8 TaxID=1884310 RepID=UPI000A484825
MPQVTGPRSDVAERNARYVTRPGPVRGKLHHAKTGAGAVAIAVAAAIPGTIVSNLLPRPMTMLTFGHPSGRLKIGAEAAETDGRRQEAGGRRQEAGGRRQEAGGRRQVTKAVMSRRARRLLVGQVFTPSLQDGSVHVVRGCPGKDQTELPPLNFEQHAAAQQPIDSTGLADPGHSLANPALTRRSVVTDAALRRSRKTSFEA